MSIFELSAMLGIAVLHSIWQVAIAAGLVWSFYKITNSKQASGRYIFSYLMLVFCLAAFVTTVLLQVPDKISNDSTASSFSLMKVLESASESTIEPTLLLEKEVSSYEFFIQKTEQYADLIGFLWIIGFFIFSVKYIVAFRLANRFRTVGVSEVEEYWQRRIRELIKETEISSKTEMMYSRLISSPLTIGFFKPLILVPTGFLMSLPPEQAEAVLLHEIAHIKRHDYAFNLLQTFIKTVFFYHPGVRFISGKIDIEREYLCDDFAVEKTDDPKSLAKALGFLQLHSFTNQNSFAMNSINKNHPFLDRLKRLFGNEKSPQKQSLGRGVFPALLLFAAVFAATAYTEINTSESDLQPQKEQNWEALVADEYRDSVPEPNVFPEKIAEAPQAAKAKFPAPPRPPAPPAPPSKKELPAPPAPPIPDFDFDFSLNLDSLPEGIDEEKLESLIEKIEEKAERIEELAEEFEDEYADKIEEMVERRLELEMELVEKSGELSEDEMEEMVERSREVEELLREQNELFEESLHGQLFELEKQTRELTEQFPQLFEDIDLDIRVEEKELAEHLAHLEHLRHIEHLRDFSDIEQEIKGNISHEIYGGMDDVQLEEARNYIRKSLVEDKLIKNKRKKATVKFEGNSISVNGKKLNKELEEKYFRLFDELGIEPHPGKEVRIHKNVFQIGRATSGGGFRGLTMIFD